MGEAARVLGLEPLLDRKPSELSGGQRQRVAMGRAMVRAPQAFLMDEPLSNLDAKLRVQMRAELARLRDQLGTTTVYVTHDQVEAMTLGDRVAVMKDGVVQQLDTPHNLYARPANLFVAAFIGSPSMNLFEATIAGDHVVFGGHRLPLAAGRLRAQDGPVVVGIRPSDFEDADVWRDETRAVLEVQVNVVEELGAEANVIFALDARPAAMSPPRAARPRRRAARRPRRRSWPRPAPRSARPAWTRARAPASASASGSRSTPPGCTSSTRSPARCSSRRRRSRPRPASPG